MHRRQFRHRRGPATLPKKEKSGRGRSSTPAAHQSGNANLPRTRPWSQQIVLRTIHLCSSGQLFLPPDECPNAFGQQS